MSTNTLNIDSIELVSTQRVAPLNGAPYSADYNDSAREVLTDLKAIFGLTPIAAGNIRWEDEPIKPVTHQMVRRGISYVPQGRRVFRDLTVYENLEIGGYVI